MKQIPTLQIQAHCQVAKAKTISLESKIDQVVYGLTDEEIKIVGQV